MPDKVQSVAENIRLPQVDRVLRHELVVEKEKIVRREILAALTRQVLARYRTEKPSAAELAGPSLDDVAATVCRQAEEMLGGHLSKVINGTGVILNTNLGRAPLPRSVTSTLSEILSGYSSLEIDLHSGKRGERLATIEKMLILLTGCEAAIVVNNNAAAVLLSVSALASNKEVIISRGELIEIGGSFRLPDVIVSAGGILKEVGTTNRTRLSDYSQAVSENTGLLLRCHRSNFEISGFTEEADLKELAKIARERNLPLVEDLGSGALLNFSELGLSPEPTVQESVAIGLDIVLFSGDKLMCGSQSGIIVGKKRYIDILRRTPIYRALRPDKLAIGLLENILAEYMRTDVASRLPIFRMAKLGADELRVRAENLAGQLNPRLSNLRCAVVPTTSAFGGGAMPNQQLPSFGLSIGIKFGGNAQRQNDLGANEVASLLRENEPPVVSIISAEQVIVDLRTVDPCEEGDLREAIENADQKVSNALTITPQ